MISAQGLFFFEAARGIIIPRIPEHPAARTKSVSCFDLARDLFVFELSSVKGIVSERLKPRPEVLGGQFGPLLGPFEGKIDDFIRVCNRNSVAGYSILKSGRVKHGAQIV